MPHFAAKQQHRTTCNTIATISLSAYWLTTCCRCLQDGFRDNDDLESAASEAALLATIEHDKCSGLLQLLGWYLEPLLVECEGFVISFASYRKLFFTLELWRCHFEVSVWQLRLISPYQPAGAMRSQEHALMQQVATNSILLSACFQDCFCTWLCLLHELCLCMNISTSQLGPVIDKWRLIDSYNRLASALTS